MEHTEENESAWTARALQRYWHDPDLVRIVKLESLKNSGRHPQVRYRYIPRATLQSILEGMRFIRLGIRGVFDTVKALVG
jgi:hypothetical protein